MTIEGIILGIIVVAGIPLLGYGIAWLRKKTESLDIANKTKIDDIIFDELESAVAELMPLAKELKSKHDDGKLTEEEAADLRDKAVERTGEMLKHHGYGLLDKLPAAALESWTAWLVEKNK